MSNSVINSHISICTCWFFHNESPVQVHESFKTYNNTSRNMHKAFLKCLTVKHHHIIACISKVISPAKTSTGMPYLPGIYICFYITSNIKIKHTVLCCCHFLVFSTENLEELIFSYNFPSPPRFLCMRILSPKHHTSTVETRNSK
jgi:hypothetical protein